MRKFILKTALFSLVILSITTVVNLLGDPANIFNGYEKRMTEIILQDGIVTNLSNYDERLLQKELILNAPDELDLAVLGSSRTMMINSTLFPSQTFLNSSVSGATIEDLIALFQVYKKNGKLPKEFILCVDPWLFNKSNNQTRWKSLMDDYNNFKQQPASFYFPLFKYQQLISFSYFQKSIQNIPNKYVPKPSKTELNLHNTRLRDGSLVYGKDFRESSVEEVIQYAKKDATRNLGVLTDFNSISPSIWADFELLCKEIMKNNIRLTFILTPYHPIVYNKVLSDFPKVIETETLINQFAKTQNLTLIGSFNPAKTGTTESGFYDGVHCKMSALQQIIKSKN
ncbi:MAG: hypothetical protein KJ941_09250 [Bacteroidetes bacterium]|nr:hypothetical protein [Bacteroidota bacterium]